jgi:ABC-type multidrug transport system fused ATPase/permease subunit
VIALYSILGISGIIGTIVMILWTIATPVLMKKLRRCQLAFMKAADQRLTLLQEVSFIFFSLFIVLTHFAQIISAIRQVKVFAWEKMFDSNVKLTRDRELSALKDTFFSKVLINIMFNFAPCVVSLVTFVTHTYILHQSLDAATAFAAIALFKSFDQSLSLYPGIINDFIASAVAIQRIMTFLSQDNIQPLNGVESSDYHYDIGYENATLSWNSFIALRNISIQFPKNKVTLITGPTGCGKSSILLGLLGEMTLNEGKIMFPPRNRKIPSYQGRITRDIPIFSRHSGVTVAYAAQQPWIFNGTIRENIVFGRRYDLKFYRKIIRISGLESDLNGMEGRDLTEIGEKGVNLSGGQKQRISLARALYSQADVILLDDPFSAIDSLTSKHIVHNLLARCFLAGKTVILVTHQVRLCLPYADHIVVLKDGQVTEQGDRLSFDQFRLESFGLLPDGCAHSDNHNEADKKVMHTISSQEFTESDCAVSKYADEISDSEGSLLDSESVCLLIKDEYRQTGGMSFQTYLLYVQSMGGYWKLAVALMFILGTKSLMAFKDVWVSYWTRLYDDTTLPLKEQLQGSVHYSTVYFLINCGIIMCLFSSNLLIFLSSLKASQVLHRDMFGRVMRSPIRFFDTTPIGRIVNRFSSDMSCIDLSIADALRQYTEMLLGQITIVFVISTVCPMLLCVLLPAGTIMLS